MRLYYHPLSSNSRRVLLTAHQLGLDLDFILVDLSAGDHRTPEYMRLNPNGKVPVLIDGPLCLWESHAIMQYLADTCPRQDVYPTEISDRADVNRWLFWSATGFAAAAAPIIRERVSKKVVAGLGAPDEQEIARGESLFAAAALVLDRHLDGKQWIAQDRLTLADLAVAAPLMHVEAAQLPIAEFRNIQRWFARVKSLDAWAKSGGQTSV